MILAAGLGTRMRPLTDHCPKPLLEVAGKKLIDFHLERLEALQVEHIAINTHWLGQLVIEHLETHWKHRLNIDIYPEERLLETAGGIVNALPSLNSSDDEPFLLINGDVYFEEDLQPWLTSVLQQTCGAPAHLLLCENPDHNPSGDFSFDSTHLPTCNAVREKSADSHQTLTYSGIGLYKPSLFSKIPAGPSPLGPILKQLARENRLHGSTLSQYWLDVGTPERLELLSQRLS